MNPSTHTDARIDHVLNALRSTEAPAGLEERIADRVADRVAQQIAQRVAARLSQTANSRQTSAWHSHVASKALISLRSHAAVILGEASRGFIRDAHSKDPCTSLVPARLYTLATLILLPTLATIAIYSHRTPHTTAKLNPIPAKPFTALEPAASLQAPIPANATRLSTTRNPQLPQGFRLGPHNPTQTVEVLTPASTPSDPDAIALAETLAPSHPAPPQPLTQQELLLLKATRKGAPIEVAELTRPDAPAFRTPAEARQDTRQEARIQRFAQSLLAPLAIAASLESTTQANDPSSPAPAPSN